MDMGIAQPVHCLSTFLYPDTKGYKGNTLFTGNIESILSATPSYSWNLIINFMQTMKIEMLSHGIHKWFLRFNFMKV